MRFCLDASIKLTREKLISWRRESFQFLLGNLPVWLKVSLGLRSARRTEVFCRSISISIAVSLFIAEPGRASYGNFLSRRVFDTQSDRLHFLTRLRRVNEPGHCRREVLPRWNRVAFIRGARHRTVTMTQRKKGPRLLFASLRTVTQNCNILWRRFILRSSK